jgi:hypothetical protein
MVDPLAHVASWLISPDNAPAHESEDEGPVTLEQLAASKFEPIGPELGAQLVERMRQCGREAPAQSLTLQLAAGLLQKTKQELVESIDNLAEAGDLDEWENMLTMFQSLAEHFEFLQTILGAIHARALIAAGAWCERDEGGAA